jgi:hypothetical protein
MCTGFWFKPFTRFIRKGMTLRAIPHEGNLQSFMKSYMYFSHLNLQPCLAMEANPGSPWWGRETGA